MPIYEYRCAKCGDNLEVMQGINDKPLRRCKKCSGKLEKQISRTSFHLKGGGWFDSGYSKDSAPKKDAAKKKAAKTTEKTGKTEKKEAKAASA